MGDPPRADKPGKLLEPLESVSYSTCTVAAVRWERWELGITKLNGHSTPCWQGELSNILDFQRGLAIA